MNNNDFLLLIPEFMAAGLAFAVLTLDFFLKEDRKHLLGYFAAGGLLATLAVTLIQQWGVDDTLYDGALRMDAFTLFFRAAFLLMGAVAILSSVEYVRRGLRYAGEYYAILIFTIVGMMLISASGELLTAYISLELLSLGLYVLASFDRYNPKSNEAGTKYILLGAVSSALLLYGISQIYGLMGTTRFDEMARVLAAAADGGGGLPPGLIVGFGMIFAGLGFKLAAVPFHMWAPDVYEGAPIPIAGWLATASKAAALALALRLFSHALMPIAADWRTIAAALAALTMTVGNLTALAQTNMKRLLAYSSVGHVGYLLMGVAALAAVDADGAARTDFSRLAVNGAILHLIAYGATSLAAFLCLTAFHNATGKDDIADLAGAARRSPFLGAALAASLLSLAGLPIFAGFVSKFYLFSAAAAQGLLWLAGIAIFASLVSLYYYLQVLRQAYIEPPPDGADAIRLPRLTVAVLGALTAVVIVIGVYPSPLMSVIERASAALF